MAATERLDGTVEDKLQEATTFIGKVEFRLVGDDQGGTARKFVIGFISDGDADSEQYPLTAEQTQYIRDIFWNKDILLSNFMLPVVPPRS